MRSIEHWVRADQVAVAESAGGVLATCNPLDNLVRAGVTPWPPPEILQKLYASERWRGRTDQDTESVSSCLGHYTDLQSLNSEDAITWSFFGPLIYGPETWRQQFGTALMERLGLPAPRDIAIWLWRRVPHPEKPASTGGPEIDFGVLTDSTVILGEAKWNSKISGGQGVLRNRTQAELRLSFCHGIGTRALPFVQHWTVLGVGREADVLDGSASGACCMRNLSWAELAGLMPDELRTELLAYLGWKTKYSSTRSCATRAKSSRLVDEAG